MDHIYRQTWLTPDLTGFYCTICGYETIDPEDISVSCRDKSRKYWYMYYETECVLCGKGHIEKRRMYYPKPENYRDRYKFTQYLCGDHY